MWMLRQGLLTDTNLWFIHKNKIHSFKFELFKTLIFSPFFTDHEA